MTNRDKAEGRYDPRNTLARTLRRFLRSQLGLAAYQKARVRRRIIHRGLTLQEAQEHCNNLETSSTTATSTVARQRTRSYGPWFDGYEKE
jgi:hypothetical protein